MKKDSLWIVYAWALDFVRALHHRSKFHKWLLKIAIGKYAYRELVGLRDALEDEWEGNTTFGYELERMDYHNDEVRL